MNNYAARVVQVVGDGSLSSGIDIVGESQGTEWIGISSQSGQALVLAKHPGEAAMVVNFNANTVAKTCPLPATSMGPIDRWLLDVPNTGVVFAEFLVGTDMAKQYAVRGMLLDPAVPCGQSFASLSKEDLKYVIADGEAGIADTGANEVMAVTLDADGSIKRIWPDGAQTYFDNRVPVEMFRDLQKTVAVVTVNNQEIMAIAIAEGGTGRNPRLAVFRKNDKTWHRLVDPSDQPSRMRGFGHFVVLIEGHAKGRGASESAGRSEWRRVESKSGPNTEWRMDDTRDVYPGKLDLYDVNADKHYAITTNQGDSEIVLVDNNTVYYRVSDRLYSAAITNAGLSPAALLATSDIIRDAHWAFYKH
jgi:hypothetical protein